MIIGCVFCLCLFPQTWQIVIAQVPARCGIQAFLRYSVVPTPARLFERTGTTSVCRAMILNMYGMSECTQALTTTPHPPIPKGYYSLA